MPWMLEVRGNDTLPLGGATPDEQFGLGVWGPAFFGANNVTGDSDANASTFTSLDAARLALFVYMCSWHGANEFRVRTLP
jgi:hypothetical protein